MEWGLNIRVYLLLKFMSILRIQTRYRRFHKESILMITESWESEGFRVRGLGFRVGEV